MLNFYSLSQNSKKLQQDTDTPTNNPLKLPVRVLCDGQDTDKTYLLGCSVKPDQKDRLLIVSVTCEGKIRSNLSLLWAFGVTALYLCLACWQARKWHKETFSLVFFKSVIACFTNILQIVQLPRMPHLTRFCWNNPHKNFQNKGNCKCVWVKVFFLQINMLLWILSVIVIPKVQALM